METRGKRGKTTIGRKEGRRRGRRGLRATLYVRRDSRRGRAIPITLTCHHRASICASRVLEPCSALFPPQSSFHNSAPFRACSLSLPSRPHFFPAQSDGSRPEITHRIWVVSPHSERVAAGVDSGGRRFSEWDSSRLLPTRLETFQSGAQCEFRCR